jgi:peptidoglycan/LPS O-acetylase OafA/YrhL
VGRLLCGTLVRRHRDNLELYLNHQLDHVTPDLDDPFSGSVGAQADEADTDHLHIEPRSTSRRDRVRVAMTAVSERGPDRSRVASLDGVRAVAALSVLVYHCAGSLNLHRTSPYGAITSRMGSQGVAVFFVLSGFLLTLPFARSIVDGEGRPSLPVFYLRRVLRIYPSYWLALTVYIWLGFLKPTSAWNNLLLFGLAHIYGSRTVLAGLGVSWTLCIEVTFYLLLPIVALLAARLARKRIGPEARWNRLAFAVIAVMLLGVSYRFVVVLTHTGPPELSWLPAYLDWFGLGMVLALTRVRQQFGLAVPRVVEFLSSTPPVSWFLGLELYWLSMQFHLPRGFERLDEMQLLGAHPVVGLAAFFFLLPVALSEGPVHRSTRFLSSPSVRFLGLISYGIFLWHRIWIAVLLREARDRGWHLTFWSLLASVIALTLVSATFSYGLIERPAMSLGERVRRRRSRRQRDATPVVVVGATEDG